MNWMRLRIYLSSCCYSGLMENPPRSSIGDYAALENLYGSGAPQQSPLVKQHGYTLFPTSSFWAAVKDAEPGQPTGWKFHLSVAPSQLAEAWAVASQYLMQEGVGQFKTANPQTRDRFAEPQHQQAGKMLTLYDYDQGPDLKPILQGLEERFAERGIRPGPAVKNDRPVPGSRYSSYRTDQFDIGYLREQGIDTHRLERYVKLDNDDLETLRQQGLRQEQLYNLSGKTDPFQSLRVDGQKALPQPMRMMEDALGKDNILAASTTKEGNYALVVPPTISRQGLIDAGFDPKGINRQAMNEHTHTLIIQPNALPRHNTVANLPESAKTQALAIGASLPRLAPSSTNAPPSGRPPAIPSPSAPTASRPSR